MAFRYQDELGRHLKDITIRQILHTDETFLAEVGRLTLAFGSIEEALTSDLVELARCMHDGEMLTELRSKSLVQLRLMDKRDLLKRVLLEIGRSYNVETARAVAVLDELGNLNHKRRTLIHGWIRWSDTLERPEFQDGHGKIIPAWPDELMKVTASVLDWLLALHTETKAVGVAVLRRYDALSDTLLERAQKHPTLLPVMMEFKQRVSGYLNDDGDDD